MTWLGLHVQLTFLPAKLRLIVVRSEVKVAEARCHACSYWVPIYLTGRTPACRASQEVRLRWLELVRENVVGLSPVSLGSRSHLLLSYSVHTA